MHKYKTKKLVKYTVKARKRQGTNSLDITIPSKIVKENKVNSGDIFEVNVIEVDKILKLEYKRIYKNQ